MRRISHQNFLWLAQYATGDHLGPVAPPRADGASFDRSTVLRKYGSQTETDKHSPSCWKRQLVIYDLFNSFHFLSD